MPPADSPRHPKTPLEIGALSPRVPRHPERLQATPPPAEALATLEDGAEVKYRPEALGEIVPGAILTNKGDLDKRLWTYKGLTPEGQAVLEDAAGASHLIAPDALRLDFERLALVFVERTPEGQEVRFDMTEVHRFSLDFYRTHNLPEFIQGLPKEIHLSPASEARLREALRQGFDQAMLVPSIEVSGNPDLQDKLIFELAQKHHPGLPDSEQYTDPFITDPVKNKQVTNQNRPSRKAYLLLYQSGPVPPETKGQTPVQLDLLFTQKNWNGLTLQEYLLLQRQELEARKNHSLDIYSDSTAKSQWTWLLDSRVPGGYLDAFWSPGLRRVGVYWVGPEDSDPGLGARPAVVVEIL